MWLLCECVVGKLFVCWIVVVYVIGWLVLFECDLLVMGLFVCIVFV